MVGAQTLASSRWRAARWLVIAPHADDETLGAGALIADASADGRLVAVAYLTDGTGSHPHDGPASRARLKAMRRAEAREACRRLSGPKPIDLLFLDWPDAEPLTPGASAYEVSRRHVAALCRRERVDAIAVTAADEPHCDHAAAFQFAVAVSRSALRPVAVFEYLVWSTVRPSGRVFATKPIMAGRRRAALAAHRSQLTPAFGEGFRLPEHQRVMSTRDRLYLKGRS